MLTLVLILLVFWVSVTLLLAALTFFLQGYFNETPPELTDVLWRAPAAGTALAVFVALWTFLAYRSPDRFAPLTDFSATETSDPFPRLWTVRGGRLEQRDSPRGKVWDVVDGKEELYRLDRSDPRRPVYSNTYRGPLPARPDVIIVQEGEEKVRFLPQRDEQGKFKRDSGQALRYYDDQGRYMEEGFLGRLTVVRTGRTVVYVLLNLAHGAVWFACAWPLLRFNLGQALVITLVCWATATLFVLPPILDQARLAARARDAAAAALDFPLHAGQGSRPRPTASGGRSPLDRPCRMGAQPDRPMIGASATSHLVSLLQTPHLGRWRDGAMDSHPMLSICSRPDRRPAARPDGQGMIRCRPPGTESCSLCSCC